MVEFCLCFFLCISGIDQLQIFEEFFLILTSDILHGIAYLMYDAQLYVSIEKNALNGIRKAGQAIYAGYKIVFHATVLKVSQNTKPEVSPSL